MFYFVVEFFDWKYKEKNIFKFSWFSNLVTLNIFHVVFVSETLLSPLPAVDIIVVIEVDV